MQWTDGMLYPLLHRLERLGLCAPVGSPPVRGGGANTTPLPRFGPGRLADRPQQWAVVADALGQVWQTVRAAVRSLRDGRDGPMRSWRPRSSGGADMSSGIVRFPPPTWTSGGPSPRANCRPSGIGLDHEDAFLVAIKRMGNLDSVSREFAREHSDRLWKQLILMPEGSDNQKATPCRELVLVSPSPSSRRCVQGRLAGSMAARLTRNLGLFIFLSSLLFCVEAAYHRAVPLDDRSVCRRAVVLNLFPFTALAPPGLWPRCTRRSRCGC